MVNGPLDPPPPEFKQRTFLGHPIGLYVLFFTEMWERFSYYGMRALLILYMVNYFKWTQKDASVIYKWYTSLVYLTPLVGGFLADRYLGNKRAVVIGAALMAIGHFLMAFEPLTIFYAALVFLILGNGMFKPNMSTQVGRLYPQNDPRRDGAYTIFYMGINLGAFLSPLICGWLAENTLGGYHSGFTVAGIGMLCGLLIYVFGLRWVQEIAQTSVTVEEKTEKSLAPETTSEAITTRESAIQAGATPSAAGTFRPEDPEASLGAPGGSPPGPLSEAAAERTPSALPFLNNITPMLLACLGLALVVGAPVLALASLIAWNTAISLEIAAVCALFSAWITSRVHGAIRDRVLAIYILGIFVVFFWAAYEQAGNVLNLWADKATDRQLIGTAAPVSVFPDEEEPLAKTEEDKPATGPSNRWVTMFQLKSSEPTPEAGKPAPSGFVIPTAWFQSINALAIFVLAPLFAYLWTALDRRTLNPSVPTKMALGLVLMGLSLGIMVFAGMRENRLTTVPFAGELPPSMGVNAEGQLAPRSEDGKQFEDPFHAGRLKYDAAAHTFQAWGVFPDNERDRIVRETAPPAFVQKVKELQVQAGKGSGAVSVQLDREPPGFDMRYSGFTHTVTYDAKTRTLTAHAELADKDVKALLVAAGDPKLRASLDALMVESSAFRVSSWWLFWSYILATLGELCLSPVGLSMVSKLAPAKFATMLMGLWMLTSFFGNFAAGAFGERYETMAPVPFFLSFVVILGAVSLVLFVLVRKVVALMHGVN
jgi:POT family proton-dependent oligopeptide transporter